MLKTFVGTLKTGTKLVGAGLLMGAGAEIAGHISSQAQDVDENHYATPHRHLQEVIKHVNESVVNRTRAARLNDTLRQKQQEETELCIDNIMCGDIFNLFLIIA